MVYSSLDAALGRDPKRRASSCAVVNAEIRQMDLREVIINLSTHTGRCLPLRKRTDHRRLWKRGNGSPVRGRHIRPDKKVGAP